MKSTSENPIGHTYIIAYPSAGVVKIGQAVYYAERVEQVRNMSPVDTEVVCALVGLHHERDLHLKFAHLRTRGEFFQDTPELRDYFRSRLDALTHDQAIASCRYTRNHPKNRKVNQGTETSVERGADSAVLTQSNKRIVLTAVDPKPKGATVMQLSGGPFVAGNDPDTEYVCDRCGAIVLRIPSGIHFAGDKGPVVFVCYGCGTANLAP